MSCPLCKESGLPGFRPVRGGDGWTRCECNRTLIDEHRVVCQNTTPPLGGVRCEEYRKLLKTLELHLRLFGESGDEPERTMRLLAGVLKDAIGDSE